MLDIIEQHRGELSALCRRYHVTRLGLFGSAASGTFNSKTSDLDFTVEFEGLTPENAADRYLGLLVELEDLFGRGVDLVCYRAIKNPFFKQAVDATQVGLYAA